MRKQHQGNWYTKEYERMAKNLYANRKRMIDRGEYDKAFDSYFETNTLNPHLKKNREKVWEELKGMKPKLSRLFSDAKGKDLDRDRKTRAKKIVVSPEEFVRLGSKNVDLLGYDTPKNLRLVGTVKGKTRYIRPEYNQKLKRIIYRDRKGRFAKIRPSQLKRILGT